MLGKHTEENIKVKELEKTIILKDQEIRDIKYSVVDVLKKIQEFNDSNNCGDQSVIKKRISELKD